ncbi:disease resistance protein Roq1-like [Rhododendron vialii]|uniref:disease resistance protein Roq1-like n=1 Tax=Rhododendron vialii TaxID=182163 RepID=UPI00265E5DB2|nr:disease resistance protein Roq1-like [Rhododendron vialii]
MGGIGKTMIAKIVYNSNHHIYDAACFLENVTGVSKGHNGLVDLQRHLLSDISGKNDRINNVDDGRWRINYALSNKRVLLVLDDVDQTEQLFALAGQQDWFSQGRKIIITTRLKSLLKNADEIYDVYWPEKLSHDESLELFSWHAFRQKCPIKSHIDLSKRFVQYCDGLPLALQVLGSSCREKSIDVWDTSCKHILITPFWKNLK